jgi:dynein heavy chain
VETWLLNLQK